MALPRRCKQSGGCRMTDPVPTSERVLQIIHEHPGIHKSELCRRTGLSWGAVSHHVGRLCVRRRMHAVQTGRRLVLLPSSLDRSAWQRYAAMAEPGFRAVIEALSEVDWCSPATLAKRTGLGEKYLRRFLGDLVEAGLLTQRGVHRPNYSLSPAIPPRSQGLESEAPQKPAIYSLAGPRNHVS